MADISSTSFTLQHAMVDIFTAFEGARTVLFVCHGNICRSPFAHYYLASRTTKDVGSAGLGARNGIGCTEDGKKAAARFKVDLQGHHSVELTRDLMRKSDIVFIFDNDNRRRMLDRFPDLIYKVFMLSDANPVGPEILEDPFLLGLEMYVHRYGQITQAIDPLLQLSGIR